MFDLTAYPPKAQTRLLVLQPTTFCNIDCRYCYLPDRNAKNIMTHDVLRRVLTHLSEDEVFGQRVEILWHAGEPLTLGVDYYREAQEIIEECIPDDIRVTQTIQTNATLINARWCKLFEEGRYNIGISLDGPQEIHDRSRRSRADGGTFNSVLRAISILQDNKIDFYVICVLSLASLADPDAILGLAKRLHISRVCFNIEETEGIHHSDLLDNRRVTDLARGFFGYCLEQTADAPFSFWIRELSSMLWSIRASAAGPIQAEVNTPFRIISVDFAGNWSTFCPELMASKSRRFADFRFGNLSTSPISGCKEWRPIFDDLHREIARGIERCRGTCDYFPVCGGGRPANKFGEHGAFDVSETRQCAVTIKALADACVAFLRSHVMADPEYSSE